MGTRVTIKGQVTIPKEVRGALGVGPGDEVEFVIGPVGQVQVRKARNRAEYQERVEAVRRRRPIKGATTDELMDLLRGDG